MEGRIGNPDSNYWADYMDKSSDEARWMEQFGFGSMEFDAAGKNVYEFDNVAMRIRGETHTNGYAYRSTPESNFNDTEMGNWPGKLTFRIYLQPADYKETIILTPVDITGYTGGDSMSDDSFPTVRYEISAPAGVNVKNLTFSAGGQAGEAIQAGGYYVIPSLSNTFTLQETEARATADSDALAGTYDIGVVNADSITATSAEGTSYDVVIADAGTLTVRYVSEPEKVLDDENPVSITTPVVTNEGQVNTQNGMAVAVIENGANFYTNGQNKKLGIVGTGTDGSGAQISLLFDDVLELNEAVGEDQDAIQLLIAHANTVQPGVTFTSGQYQFKYLDLVNANDGNAWVSTDKDITVFWPYSAAVKANYSDYSFQVVHFTGLHREDYADGSNGVMDQINHSGVEVLAATATANGVKFTLRGNAETGSFSPFALVWQKTGGGSGETTPTTYYTLHYESNGGTEYKDERYAKNTVVSLDKVPTREGYVFTGWYADEALTQKITSIKMTSDKTVYAGWRKATVPGMLNGEDHFAYIIGYTDGLIRPLDDISRAEVAAVFFRLLQQEVREAYLTDVNPFTDVPAGMWCNKAISTLNALGVFKGKTETYFNTSASITRAEFAAVCARFDTGVTEGDSNFTDIAGHWAEAEIERAASLGWIRGYADGTFRPDQPITRAEAMTMINRVLCRLPEDEDDLLEDMNVWPDNRPGDWYYLAVQEATNTHVYKPKGEIYETWTQKLEDPDWTQYQ